MLFKRLVRGWRYTLLVGAALPVTSKRVLLRRMVAFSQALPALFSQPLPAMLAGLTPAGSPERPSGLTVDEVRDLADAVAAWHLGSPLGLCLRRSLLRYHFLREAHLPVSIVFGARLRNDFAGGTIGGHAWLVLDGAPYYEDPADYAGFVEMYRYPADDRLANGYVRD